MRPAPRSQAPLAPGHGRRRRVRTTMRLRKPETPFSSSFPRSTLVPDSVFLKGGVDKPQDPAETYCDANEHDDKPHAVCRGQADAGGCQKKSCERDDDSR